MHFALPHRKSSHPPPYAVRSSRSPLARLARIRNPRSLAILALGVIAFIWFLSSAFSGSEKEVIPPGTPPVVIVTTIDPKDKAISDKVKQNREEYAKKWGYTTFFPPTNKYKIGNHPVSWSKVPAMRHAMTLNPHSTYFWYLSPHALIMNYTLSIEQHIMNKQRLESLMITNVPVVPPDSVIKTFSHLKGDRIDLVLTQDKDGLSQESFIVRRGEWAKYFLDAWFDPLYRSYNFQKAEAHALEHIVQWHGTILAKLALVPQRTLNSYTRDGSGANKDGMFAEGDFVANFAGCDKNNRDCEEEMKPFFGIVNKKVAEDST